MKTAITKEDIDRIEANSDILETKVGDKTTCVTLITASGFEITETSACVDPKNYNQVIGAQECMKRIRQRLWELEGYRLQNELATARAIENVATVQVLPMTERLNQLRFRCKEIEIATRDIKRELSAEIRVGVVIDNIHAEAIAQAMLAVRHLEDARMRLGKVIQYTEGNGESIYDTKKDGAA